MEEKTEAQLEMVRKYDELAEKLRPDHLTDYDFANFIEHTAMACHATNQAYIMSMGVGGGVIPADWEHCSPDLRFSAQLGVLYSLDSNKTPKEMHSSWSETRKAQGWVYGEVKDDTLKTHPNLVPYEELPEKERNKDIIFMTIVGACKTALYK